MNDMNVAESIRLLNSMLNASRTCSPGFIAKSSSIVSVAQCRHELRVGHLVRGPEAVRQVARRSRRADDLLREAREAIRLRHDDTQARHRRLRIMPGPVRRVEDLGHLREVALLPELPFVRPLLRERLDSELVEEGHGVRFDARSEG